MMKYTLKDFFRQLTDILFVHLLWILVSFLGLLITFGAATTALFKVMFQIYKIEEPTHVTKLFFKTFKEEFLESTLSWLMILVVAVPLFFMISYAYNTNSDILLILGIVIAYQLLMFFIYVFPVIAVFKSKSFGSMLKNVLLLQNRHMLTNIKLLGSLVIFIAGMLWVHGALILLLIPCYGFLMSFHLKSVFQIYINEFKKTISKENDYELPNI